MEAIGEATPDRVGDAELPGGVLVVPERKQPGASQRRWARRGELGEDDGVGPSQPGDVGGLGPAQQAAKGAARTQVGDVDGRDQSGVTST